jgi:hypothetical protein
MLANLYTKVTLTAIAVFLGVLALHPLAAPQPVSAQSGGDSPDLYIEPGTTVIRKPDGSAQMQGKVVIDLRTGDVWGFPTIDRVPYPVDWTKSTPPVSPPMYLGKFDFSKMRR